MRFFALLVTMPLLAACGSISQLGSRADVTPTTVASGRPDAEPVDRPRASHQSPPTDQYDTTYTDDADTTASVPNTPQKPRSGKKTAAKKSDEPLKPYSPEWWAKEKEVDDRLKKTMVICNGC